MSLLRIRKGLAELFVASTARSRSIVLHRLKEAVCHLPEDAAVVVAEAAAIEFQKRSDCVQGVLEIPLEILRILNANRKPNKAVINAELCSHSWVDGCMSHDCWMIHQ